ncbi:MAG: tRNA (cytidine(34)-2'-O)-methyltransferase [Planctomycetaceae bacterium]
MSVEATAGPSTRPEPLMHVVLYQPEIPQNTGNIGRSCVAVGAKLWMVRPLGFHLDDRYLKRAGMDYWQHLDWEVVDDWATIEQKLPNRTFWLFTKFATQAPWEAEFQQGDVLVFGSESSGLPERLRLAHQARCLKFPMSNLVRSLNLASTVNAALYESVRQLSVRPSARISGLQG